MGCCILGALIISGCITVFRRLRLWLVLAALALSTAVAAHAAWHAVHTDICQSP